MSDCAVHSHQLSTQMNDKRGRVGMLLTRRRILSWPLGAPGGSATEGDFRDRLCRMLAAEIEKRTGGALTGQVYPNSSLMKTVAQFSALRKGALDLSLYPVSYAGGEFAELNIGLMPGLVSSYKQGAAWKSSPVGQKCGAFVADKVAVILSGIWQAGGVVSRDKPLVNP